MLHNYPAIFTTTTTSNIILYRKINFLLFLKCHRACLFQWTCSVRFATWKSFNSDKSSFQYLPLYLCNFDLTVIKLLEQNLSCQKLAYILSMFHRPSQGGILWKQNPREFVGCFSILYWVALPIFVPTVSFKLMTLPNIRVEEALLSKGSM